MEWVELRKLLEFQKKSKIKAGDGQSAGKYAMYTSSMTLDKYLDEYQYDKEALIMGTGGKANIHYSTGQFNTSTDCYVLYKKTENIVLKYIYLFLFGNIHILEEGFRGAGLKHINQKYVKEIKIPVPAMEIQGKIVEVLDEAQALIDKRKEQIQLLDRLIESTFYTMFGDPVKNEKGWEFKTLEDLILGEMQNGLYKPSEFYTDSLEGTPIVRIDTFYNGKITNYNFKRLRCTKQEIEKFLLTNNEIVINRVNSIEYLGKSALIKGLKEKTVFESNMMKFKTKSASINNRYLIEVFNTKYFKNQILSRAKKAVNQASINQGDVKSFVVPLPPFPLQNEFAEKVEVIEKQKKLLEKSLELLEENYKSIMDKAFKGQLWKV